MFKCLTTITHKSASTLPSAHVRNIFCIAFSLSLWASSSLASINCFD